MAQLLYSQRQREESEGRQSRYKLFPWSRATLLLTPKLPVGFWWVVLGDRQKEWWWLRKRLWGRSCQLFSPYCCGFLGEPDENKIWEIFCDWWVRNLIPTRDKGGWDQSMSGGVLAWSPDSLEGRKEGVNTQICRRRLPHKPSISEAGDHL